VTDVSAISQYIYDGKNGFLLSDNKPGTIARALNEIAQNKGLHAVSASALLLTEKFTYEYFAGRIQKEIYNK
jgi:glycosyltransferase involved in cell wall biosynthesis